MAKQAAQKPQGLEDTALLQTVSSAFEARSTERDRTRPKLGKLYSSIKSMFTIFSRDARSVFRGFFPAFGDKQSMQKHASSLFLPKVKNETEESLRERLSTASRQMKYLGTRRTLSDFMRSYFPHTWTRVIEMPRDAFIIGNRAMRISYKALFSARSEHRVVSFNNRLWLIGGRKPAKDSKKEEATNEVWSSLDGNAWVQHSVPASFSPRYGHGCSVLTHKGTSGTISEKLWITGGHDGTSVLKDVWSFDGTTWKQEKDAGFSARYRHGCSVLTHKGTSGTVSEKLWVSGGHDGTKALKDAWSFDGTTWKQESLPSPFSARYGHGSSAFTYKIASGTVSEKLWITGGHDGYKALKDAWSFDGTTWKQESLPSPFSARYGHGSAVLTDTETKEKTNAITKKKETITTTTTTLWVSGGHDGKKALNDVWSFDGTTWKEHKDAVFSPRVYHHMAGYDNTLMLIGGERKTEKYKDIWSFDGSTWRDYYMMGDELAAGIGSKTARISAGPGLYISINQSTQGTTKGGKAASEAEAIESLESYLAFNTPPYVGYLTFKQLAEHKPLDIYFTYDSAYIDEKTVQNRVQTYFQRIDMNDRYKHKDLQKLFIKKEKVVLKVLIKQKDGTMKLKPIASDDADFPLMKKDKSGKVVTVDSVYFPVRVFSETGVLPQG